MNKFKMIDFDQFDADVPNKKSNYMRMLSHIKSLNENIRFITDERNELEN